MAALLVDTAGTECCICPPPVEEACCLDKICSMALPNDCLFAGGIPMGIGTTCADTDCPASQCPTDVITCPFLYSITVTSLDATHPDGTWPQFCGVDVPKVPAGTHWDSGLVSGAGCSGSGPPHWVWERQGIINCLLVGSPPLPRWTATLKIQATPSLFVEIIADRPVEIGGPCPDESPGWTTRSITKSDPAIILGPGLPNLIVLT